MILNDISLFPADKQRGLRGAGRDRRRGPPGVRAEAAARRRVPPALRRALRVCAVHRVAR